MAGRLPDEREAGEEQQAARSVCRRQGRGLQPAGVQRDGADEVQETHLAAAHMSAEEAHERHREGRGLGERMLREGTGIAPIASSLPARVLLWA